MWSRAFSSEAGRDSRRENATRQRAGGFALALWLAAGGAWAEEAPLGLGRAATEAEIAAWDIDVRPDGQGLPEGRGTAEEGGLLYDGLCAACHGDFGEGAGRWAALAGGRGTLTHRDPLKTIGSYWPHLSTVFDYTRRAMPFHAPRSLTDDEAYAITAYILYLNDLVEEESFELSRENFTDFALPNAEGFIEDDRWSEPQYAPGLEPCMSDCLPGAAKIIGRARAVGVTPDGGGGFE
ncbi:c-type cytochrome [Neomegalonema perideroedes]|uniref:c-type cytochrome n=1 Tax=Neomegalonema perideroedes TaxID=217219 RepID=UPI00036932A4|nr:cytochrome c [Neomegalonema perideroedes]